MLLRFWHFLVGHQWKDHCTSLPAVHPRGYYTHVDCDDRKFAVHGFTELNRVCHCGASLKYRFTGVVNVRDNVSDIRRSS
jgi:hypothetical protein